MSESQQKPSTNFVQHVAVIGAGGQVGRQITEHLLRTGKHTVTALTRKTSTSSLPSGVRIATFEYEDESTIVEALAGQQFLVITLASSMDQKSQSILIQAAAKAGVSYVMPNWYGKDLENSAVGNEVLVTVGKAAVKEIQEAGMKSIPLTCGFWYEFSLGGNSSGRGGTVRRFGFDFPERKLVLIDGGTQKINTSTLEQCGRAVAALLSLPEHPAESHQDVSDRSSQKFVSDWANKSLYCSSFTVSQLDMFESVKRVTGTSDADWTITQEDSVDRYKRGMKAWTEHKDAKGLICASYTRVFFRDGAGNFQETRGLDNGVLGLPEEDLDSCTRRAIDASW